MKDVFIAGVSLTPFGKFPELSLRELASRAAENACASSSTAFQLATVAVAAGAADIVVDAEKLTNPGASRTFGVFNTAARPSMTPGPRESRRTHATNRADAVSRYRRVDDGRESMRSFAVDSFRAAASPVTR